MLRIAPMPELLRLPLGHGLVLEVARHAPRGRTFAMLLFGGRCLWYGLAAEA